MRSRIGTRGARDAGLFREVDCASLTWFRICFGLVMVWQSAKYLVLGWVEETYVEPRLHFTFFGFDWVRPWPGEGMTYHFLAMIALSAFVAAGFAYRVSAMLLFVTVTHWFLIETTQYNNHYYLQCLLAFLLVFMPAHRGYSVDALLRPKLRTPTVPVWTIWLLRFQIAVVYFYGGLAKLDPDWLTGVPARAILGGHAETPVIGAFTQSAAGGLVIAYSGLFVDLAIVPFLLWRRTRMAAFLVAVVFHVSNAYLFRIGVFPWFMVAATLLFFEPDWPRRVARALRRNGPSRAGADTVSAAPSAARGGALVGFLGLYAAVQLLVPLRHHLYPGRVTWTEEGMRFAWHMMLRHKLAKAEFVVQSKDGEPLPVEMDWPITPKQWQFMQYDPAAVLQFAHYLADEARRQGFEDVQVRALVHCSLNGREPQPLVDPTRDLAAERRSWPPAPWIVPLRTRLPPREPYGGRLTVD